MKFIPWSLLETTKREEPVVEVATPKKEKKRAKALTDAAFTNISTSLEITRVSLTKITPDIFHDQLISRISATQNTITLEDVDRFISIMKGKKSFETWKGLWAHAGGTYLAILDFLELSNGFLHIHPFNKMQKIDVEDIFPSPKDPTNSRFLADLVMFASKHLDRDSNGFKKIIEMLPEEEQSFATTFVTICYVYFSTIFYTMRFINPSLIDTWAEVFELTTDDSAEKVAEACQCWWDNPQ